MPDEDLDVLFGVVPRRTGERLKAVHIAVVVSAEKVNLVKEPAVTLRQVIRSVGRKVGVNAVAASNHAIFVVAKVSRPHPHGIVFVVHVPLSAKSRDRVLNQRIVTTGVQSALAKPHIELDVESRERILDFLQLQFVPDVTGYRDCLVARDRCQVRLTLEGGAPQFDNVLPGITVFRCRFTQRGGKN